MTVTSAEPLYADGLCLTTHAIRVQKRSASWVAPSVRGSNTPVPARHGALHVAGKSYEQGEIGLELHVFDRDADGAPGGQQQLRANMARLLRTVDKRHELVTLEQHLLDGSVRQCGAECVAAVPFDPMRGLAYAKCVVDLRVPGAFWRDTGDTTWTSPAGIQDEQVLDMDPFNGSTAPLADLTFMLRGPADSPQLRGFHTGSYVAYQGNLALGEQWRVNAATWTSVVGTDLTVDGGGTTATSVISESTHGGSARFLELAPADPPRIIASGGNFGAETAVSAMGRRSYLIS